jgi:NAD(P)-dependent dehydrogenase (short-subunit alcohol dehydrogenase family)
MLDERRETAQGFEAVFGTDHLGHFLLTNLLLEQVRAAGRARIVVVASEAHRMARRGIEWGDLDRHAHYRPWVVYGEAKLANILHARALAARLEGTGVVVHSLHPGSVRTNFGRQGDTSGLLATIMEIGNPLLVSPAKGALTSIHVASAPDAGASTGLYWRRQKPVTPSRAARDRGAAEHLWAVSERMIAAGAPPTA